MRTITRQRLARISLLVIPAALVALAGCASTEGVEQEQVYQAPDGFAVVDTLTYVATVAAIDTSTRKVTLTTPDGKSHAFKAAKSVDLGSFKVGEQIGVQATEAMALAIRRDGAPPGDAAAVALAAASDGKTTGVFTGQAIEVSAKVVAVDPSSRKVTFQFADGSTETMRAHKNVDLTGLSAGETIIVEYAESLVIATSNP